MVLLSVALQLRSDLRQGEERGWKGECLLTFCLVFPKLNSQGKDRELGLFDVVIT